MDAQVNAGFCEVLRSGPAPRGLPREPVRPLPEGFPGRCTVHREVLTAGECRRLIALAEGVGYAPASPAYPPSYRNNDRLVLDNPGLARALLERLRPQLPKTLTDPDGTRWRLAGLNERFRLCRYRAGQRFSIHRDGVFHRSGAERSKLTFMVYLNEADEFEGGDTRFFRDRDDSAPPLCRIQPEAGALIVFDHDLWHDGEEVRAGVKYILRSDILYTREPTASPEVELEASHLGYLWCALELRDGRLATASRDKSIRLWRRSGTRLEPLGVLRGHENSVTALCEAADGALWSGSRDRTIRIWGGEGGGSRALTGHEGAVLALVRVGSGELASGSADGSIRLWSPGGACTRVLRGHASWVWALAATPEGELLSGSEDGTVRHWSPASTTSAHGSVTHGAPVRAVVALRGHGPGAFASGAADGSVCVWTRDEQVRRLLGHTGAVRALAELPGGRLASGAEDDSIRIWNLADGACVATHRHGDFVTSLQQLRDGLLASTSYDGMVGFWSVG